MVGWRWPGLSSADRLERVETELWLAPHELGSSLEVSRSASPSSVLLLLLLSLISLDARGAPGALPVGGLVGVACSPGRAGAWSSRGEGGSAIEGA